MSDRIDSVGMGGKNEREPWTGTCPTCQQPNRTGEVTVDRAVLADILEQIEATWKHDGGRDDHDYCDACGVEQPYDVDLQHKPDCRYVRVRDYLKGLGL